MHKLIEFVKQRSVIMKKSKLTQMRVIPYILIHIVIHITRHP